MLIAAKWQWTRYHEKNLLVEQYHNHEKSKPILLISDQNGQLDLSPYLHQKVEIKGEYDFNTQVAVTNRRHRLGTGHWLLTPFKPNDAKKEIIISRGFIPYEDREESSWAKYSRPTENIVGVVQKTVSKRSSFSPSAKMPFPKLYLYPDLLMISEDLKHNIDTGYYIQSISEPIFKDYPSTDISIDVPPSTHFWYTFEWIALSFLTSLIAFLIQLFRPRHCE